MRPSRPTTRARRWSSFAMRAVISSSSLTRVCTSPTTSPRRAESRTLKSPSHAAESVARIDSRARWSVAPSDDGLPFEPSEAGCAFVRERLAGEAFPGRVLVAMLVLPPGGANGSRSVLGHRRNAAVLLPADLTILRPHETVLDGVGGSLGDGPGPLG